MQLTIGTDVTTAQVATAIKELINGDTQAGTGDHTFSATGDKVGEFSRLVATVSGSVVSVTTDDDDIGKPFTMSVTESTAGSGTATETTATTATGPNHWDNADNWSGDTVPVDGDDIVYDDGETDCLYGISTSMQPATLTVTQGYEGKIGLPRTNTDDTSYPYDEYRETHLTFTNHAGTTTFGVEIGRGSGNGSGRINLDTANSTVTTVNVYNSGQRAESDVPAILFINSDDQTVMNVSKGDIGIAFYEDESAHLSTLNVGFLEDQAGDSTVVLGGGVDTANAAITQSGGTLTIDSATGSGTIDLIGGELNILSGAHASIDIDGGSVFYQSSGTITTALVGGGGTLDLRRDLQSRTITNCELHARGSLFDTFKTATFTNGVDLVRTNLDEVTLDLGNHVTVTPSAI